MKACENIPISGMKMAESLERLLDNKRKKWLFPGEPVPPEIILEIFETARNVTSGFSYKAKDWMGLMVNRNEKKFNQLLECLDEFNKKAVETAPCLGAIFEKTIRDETGEDEKSNFYNTEVFKESAYMQAKKSGYLLYQMTGFSDEFIKLKFNIPDDYELKIVFAIGKKDKTKKVQKNHAPVKTYLPRNNFAKTTPNGIKT